MRQVFAAVMAAVAVILAGCTSAKVSPTPIPRPTRTPTVLERSLAINAREWINTHPRTVVRACLGARCQLLGRGLPHHMLALFALPPRPLASPAPAVKVTVVRQGQRDFHRRLSLDPQPKTHLHPCGHPIVFDDLVWVTAFSWLRAAYTTTNCQLPV
jgi:hypothetical protein